MPETANEATALRPKPQRLLPCCCLFDSMIHPFASSSMCRIKSTDSLAFTDPLCYQFIWRRLRHLCCSVWGEVSRLLAKFSCVRAGSPVADLSVCKTPFSLDYTNSSSALPSDSHSRAGPDLFSWSSPVFLGFVSTLSFVSAL